MRPLSVQEMIVVWEAGELRSPLDQSLLLLSAGEPDASLQDLAKLHVGERDRRLLKLREQTIGSRFSCFVECPWCREELQFEFDTGEILRNSTAVTTEPLTATTDGLSVTFRLPNSEDLAEALGATSPEESRYRVFKRCVLEIRQGGNPIAVGEVPESAIERICDLVGSSDPQADVQLGVECLSCGKGWKAPFDVTSFFWKEISVRARRALSEVHVLATAYGWKESDILRMGAARRDFYLQMVSA